MTINLDAFKAHVEISLNQLSKNTRESTFFNVLCFHIVQRDIESSRVSMVISSSYNVIDFPTGSADFTQETIDKITAITTTFFLKGGKAMMFLVTDQDNTLSLGDKIIIDNNALSIASEVYPSAFELEFKDHILYEFTNSTTRINTNPMKCVFFSKQEGFIIDGEPTDNLLMLSLLFSKQGKEFATEVISYKNYELTNYENGILTKNQIMSMSQNGMSFFEVIDTPTTARFGNFMIGKYTDMGMYLFLYIKIEVEQMLDVLITGLKYNALTMKEGSTVNSRPNCLGVIYSRIHKILREYATQGLIEETFKIIVPDQSIDNKQMRIITGIKFGYDPLNTISRMELEVYSARDEQFFSFQDLGARVNTMKQNFLLANSKNISQVNKEVANG